MTEKPAIDGWTRMSFKGRKVWAQADATGDLIIKNGKVLVKYQLDQPHEYQVKRQNLLPETQAVPSGGRPAALEKKAGQPAAEIKPKKPPESAESFAKHGQDLPDRCIRIYTDGASSGNPGPAGIGVLLIYGKTRKEISSFIGITTNNVAELTAIRAALKELKRFDLPVRIFTDSTYVIGVLTKGWKARANQELIGEIRSLIDRFRDLALIKVQAHAGIKENEVADYLATSASKKGPDSIRA